MTGEEIGRTPPRRERRLRTPTTKDFAPISNKLHTDPTQPGLGSDNGLAATSPVRHGKEKCHEKLVRESAPPELAKLASSTQIRPALPQEPAQKKGGRPMTERRGSGSEEALVVQPITVPTPSEPTLHNHAAQGLQQPPHQVAVTHRPHGTTTPDKGGARGEHPGSPERQPRDHHACPSHGAAGRRGQASSLATKSGHRRPDPDDLPTDLPTPTQERPSQPPTEEALTFAAAPLERKKRRGRTEEREEGLAAAILAAMWTPGGVLKRRQSRWIGEGDAMTRTMGSARAAPRSKQKGHDEHPFAVDEHKLGNSGEPVKAGKERRTLGQKSGLGTFPGLTGRTVTRDDRCQVKGPALRNDAGSRRAGRMQDLPVGIAEQPIYGCAVGTSRRSRRTG
ncbi:hypothetical protein BDA96_10G041500 [Sorghum bicolor]|uniref:Uncharacterized protein n=1 Tax=Sorghum bicolor TaxID=4558 RepID=A0A921TZN5_SORBI|nr:hypothetical protein BDA96_10G041500 [Sorghum bicolor]